MVSVYEIQSISFNKDKWTKKKAKKWLKSHKYKRILKKEESRHQYIFSISYPDYKKYLKMNTYDGVSFVLGSP